MFLAACLLSATSWASAQVRLTGTVVSAEDGQPVVGASVIVPGTKVGVVTDMDGKFSLTVPEGKKKLRVSSIGMDPQEVPVKDNQRIVLQSNSSALNEVVVVGYGSGQKLGTVVGSVTQVKADKIDNKPVPNVLDALQGQVAGLNIFTNTGDPGDGSNDVTVNIRGLGSLNAGTTPLFVVDGTPANSDILRMLNSNDIASVTVLKDASATSIYGSRAANGVIYITTKRGKSGKAQITFGQTIGWSSLARRISNPMNASELLDWQLKYGIIDQKYYDHYKQLGNDWDWQDYFFKDNAPMYQTNFSVQGGSDKVNYYTSASYYKENGLVPNSQLQRYTLRSNIDARPTNWFHYGLNLNVTYDKRHSSNYTKQASNSLIGGVFGTMLYAPYWETPYNEDGSPKDVIPGANRYSVYYEEAKNPTYNNNLQTNSSAFVEITPLKGLKFKSQLGVEAGEQRTTSITYFSYKNDASVSGKRESFSRYSLWTMTNTAEYSFQLADLHHFTVLLGQEGIKQQSDGFSALKTGNGDDRLMMFNNGTSVTAGDVTDSYDKYEYLSFFGRLDYSFNDKYFFNFTARNDQSSRFGKENRGAWFYSGGLMWNAKKEHFLQDVDWISGLQFRASVGSTGNSAIGNYDHLATTGTTQYAGQTGWIVGVPGNEQLGWEKVVQTNVGVNISFLDRFIIDFAWYNRATSNMLMTIPVQYTTGFTTNEENMGSMRNRGVELTLSADVVKTRDFKLNLHANISHNNQKITKLFYGLQEWPMLSYNTSYIVGSSTNFFMPIYAGVDKENGKPMWYKKGFKGGLQHEFNSETMTEEFDRISLSQDTGKKLNAPTYGGFGLTASWKGLTLNADFSYVLGKYLYNNDYYFENNPAQFGGMGLNQSKDVLNSWEKPGDITDEPSVKEMRQFDTHSLENASFLRLKNLTLSYDLPKSWLAATKFVKGFRITLTGRNLFTVTKYRGADPEINANVTYGAYPSTRQFSVGGEITF